MHHTEATELSRYPGSRKVPLEAKAKVTKSHPFHLWVQGRLAGPGVSWPRAPACEPAGQELTRRELQAQSRRRRRRRAGNA